MKPTREELIQEIRKVGLQIVQTEYRGVTIIPIREIKPKVMKHFRINRVMFDKILLSKFPSFHEDGLGLSGCGRRQTTYLHYVTRNPEHPTFMDSYCFFHINKELREAQKT